LNFTHVYTHRSKVPALELVPTNPSPVDGSLLPSASSFNLDILITLRKGKWSCTGHLILNFISYDQLNLTFCQFTLFLSSESIHRSYTKALLVLTWKQTMDEKMKVFTSKETWEFASAPTDAAVVGCR